MEKGVRWCHYRGKEHGESASVVTCGSALGFVILPVVLFKGKKSLDHLNHLLPPGSKIIMTEKGSMTHETCVQFVQHLAMYKPQGECLLIMDGAKCHLNIVIIEEDEKHGIRFLCLPCNTTHELQPMDKSVFRPFELAWDDEVETHWEVNKTQNLTKVDFCTLLTKVFKRAVTPSNVTAGFKAFRIHLFCPTIIPDSAYAPSELTQNDDEDRASVISDSSIVSISEEIVTDYLTPSLMPSTSVCVSSLIHSTTVHASTSSKNTPNASSNVPSLLDFSPLKTPELEKSSAKLRKKALNYKAVYLERNLFPDQPERPKKVEGAIEKLLKK